MSFTKPLWAVAIIGVGVISAYAVYQTVNPFTQALAAVGGESDEKIVEWCNHGSDRWLEKATKKVDRKLELTDAQKQAWTGVENSLRDGVAGLRATCETELKKAKDQPAPVRLAAFEVLSQTGLDVFKNARPAFETFYESLNAEQKKEVDEAFSHRRHRRWH